MLEYFTYKKFKKNKGEGESKEAKEQRDGDKGKSKEGPAIAVVSGSDSKPSLATKLKERHTETPILDDDDESFFKRLTSGDVSVDELGNDDEGSRPPLPPRMKTPDLSWDSDSESFVPQSKVDDKVKEKDVKDKGKAKETDKRPSEPSRKDSASSAVNKIGRRISLMVRRPKKEVKPTNLAVPEPEADREKDDLTRVLDNLNLSAQNNRVFSLSPESNELVRKFTFVLKDLVNGVPTAVDDLKGLLDDKDGTLSKGFEGLPSSLKKLVTSLPAKMSGALAPELLAVAAESQGLKHEDNSKSGLKATAKSLLIPSNMADLVTKPSAIVGMLKALMNALKLRWPAFIGTNVLWSVALFLLLFVLWYCHKRGREVRLERERSTDGASRIEELPDDPALPEASGSQSQEKAVGDAAAALPPPPVGPGATGQKSPSA